MGWEEESTKTEVDYTQILLNFGEEVDDLSFLEQLQFRIWNDLLHRPTRNLQFPGSQPVSFGRRHLGLLEKEDYYVCEKSDGVRYLLYYSSPFGEPTAFLIDRNFKASELRGLFLPGKIQKTVHVDTLLDGELICEGGQDPKDKTFVFMIFDALLISGKNVMQENLTQRLKYIQNDVITPWNQARKDPNFEYPFELGLKKMWKPYAIAEILEREIPQLNHGNDGLIFTPVQEPYTSGTFEKLLKWKPSELNTVDFKLIIVNKDRYELHVATKNNQHRFFTLHPPDSSLDDLDGSIIECRFDQDKEQWLFTRVRGDKLSANYERIVEKIIDSIKDNVTSSELINRIPAIRRSWKERESSLMTPAPHKRAKIGDK